MCFICMVVVLFLFYHLIDSSLGFCFIVVFFSVNKFRLKTCATVCTKSMRIKQWHMRHGVEFVTKKMKVTEGGGRIKFSQQHRKWWYWVLISTIVDTNQHELYNERNEEREKKKLFIIQLCFESWRYQMKMSIARI